ncbi:MAG: hypothetical protein Q9217_005952 [Psora testacea]
MGPGSDIPSVRKSKDSGTTAPINPPVSSTPLSFRMATEDMLDKETTEAGKAGSDSTYGVQSLQDTIDEAIPDISDERHSINENDESDGLSGRRRSALRSKAPIRESASVSSDLGRDRQLHTADSSPSRLRQHSPPPSISHSLTSLSLDSQAPLSSLPSSPKSYSNRSIRPSDEDSMDEAGNQAIFSSSEDDAGSSSNIQDSAPQLIMPSIKMPSRRPFTDRGKGMGRLKVLIAGESGKGVGKTSLIRSIVQTCEDIVHVDSLSPSFPSVDQNSKKSKRIQTPSTGKSTQLITEIYASTRAYPPWWSDIDDTKVLRRRKSIEDTVLERNLCFVDTPGYSSGMSKMETIETVLEYIEGQLKKSFSVSSPGDGDIVSLLSGSGGSQVDVVFYMIYQDIKHEDIIFLQRLSALTNIIVLIAKADTLSHEETEIIRRSISTHLGGPSIRAFQFRAQDARQPPFTVCSAPSDDDDNMDASLLMSSDYVQPLIPSELGLLVQQIFDKDVGSCLRHLAATKLVQAQRGSKALTLPPSIPHALSYPISNQQLTFPGPTSPLSLQTTISNAGAGMSPYVQARIADHTQQEEKLAQIRLAKWAADLQRSLQNERERYEGLARGEQAVWLSQKLEEVAREDASASTRVPTLMERSERSRRCRRSGMAYHYGHIDADDPLGLLQWNEILRRRGWIAMQVAGGFGILGAVVVWVARSWSLDDNGLRDWDLNWWREG